MKTNYSFLKDELALTEIRKHKWIESEKLGKDIGWEQARQEWLAKHFPAWKQDRWQRAIREAETAEVGLN